MWIDRWVRRIGQGPLAELSLEETAALIAEKIFAAELPAGGKLLLLGSGDVDGVKGRLCPLLGDICPLEVGNSLISDQETVKKARACDAAILVEQLGKSDYRDVEKNVDALRKMDRRILGFVLTQ